MAERIYQKTELSEAEKYAHLAQDCMARFADVASDNYYELKLNSDDDFNATVPNGILTITVPQRFSGQIHRFELIVTRESKYGKLSYRKITDISMVTDTKSEDMDISHYRGTVCNVKITRLILMKHKAGLKIINNENRPELVLSRDVDRPELTLVD